MNFLNNRNNFFMSKGKRTISPDNGDDKVPESYYIGEFRYRIMLAIAITIPLLA